MPPTALRRLCRLPAANLLVCLLGLAAGIGMTSAHVRLLDLPIDMAVYREGVRAFFDGRAVYSAPMRVGDLELPFIYPPFGAVALSPFAVPALSDNAAGALMVVLSSALILACLIFVYRAIVSDPDQVAPLAAIAWPAALAIEPVVLNDRFAQINTVLMAMVVLDLVPRRRRLPQGWLIGLAIAIKLSPAAMLLYFLLKRRLGPIITAGVSAAAATALAATINWNSAREFFQSRLLSMASDSEFGVDTTYTSNSSLKGAIMRLAPSTEWLDQHEATVNAVWLMAVLAVILLGSWIMLRLLAARRDVDAWLLGALVMLLSSPVSWSHHWVWLGLILPVVAYRAVTEWPRVRWTAWVAALWAALVLTSPPKWWFGDGIELSDLENSAWLMRIVVSDFTILSLAFFAALAADLRRAARTRLQR